MNNTIKINKAFREIILNKYGGRCAYCGIELKKGWHIDHLEPIVRNFAYDSNKGKFQSTGTCRNPQNDNLENYNPSCASCNIQKNSFTLEEFRKNIKQFVSSLNSYSTQYKFAKRYGLIKETNSDVIFYFETFKS